MEDIGDLGEDDFKRWCTGRNLTATKSAPDKMGWDYFVEFSPAPNPAIPLDRQNALPKALVQVKSSRKQSTSVRAKLSALKRLVDTDLPAFIVQLVYSDSDKNPEARILHVGETQIESILKRVRQAEADGRTDLHKITMTLSLDEAGKAEYGSDELNEVLSKHLKSTAYCSEKAAFRNSCGYGEDSIKARVSFSEGVGSETLVDLMLGIIPDVSMDEMEVDKRRFGIPLGKDIDFLSKGRMSVSVTPSGTGTIQIASKASGKRAKITVEIIVPNLPWLQQDEMKLRLRNEFFDLVFHMGRGTCRFNFNFDPKKEYAVEELDEALRFLLVLCESDAAMEADLDGKGRIEFQSFPPIKPPMNIAVSQQITELLSKAAFNHRVSTPLVVSLEEIEAAISRDANMVAVLTQPGIKMVATQEEKVKLPRYAAIFIPSVLDFEKFCYMAIARSEASLKKRRSGKIEVVGRKPQVIEDFLSATADLDMLNERLQNHARRLDKDEWSFALSMTQSEALEDFP